MNREEKSIREFFHGVVSGSFGTLLAVALLAYFLGESGQIHFATDASGSIDTWLQWAYLNLGSSIPVFALLGLAYVLTLRKLRSAVSDDAAITRIVHLDQLTDIWTTLFFGTGVIWTAIGMRSALIFALGDRAAALQQGAFAMLERMVEGGILLALSTTIFGGIGGYLMRVYKTVSLGTVLQQRYDAAAREDTTEMHATLLRIEERLQT